MDDDLWSYCQSGQTVRNSDMEEYMGTDNETFTISSIQVSSVNICDKWHAVIKNEERTMGKFPDVQ